MEATASSTLKELRTACQVLYSTGTKLMDTRMRWLADNQNVANILQVGSRKHAVQEEVERMFIYPCSMRFTMSLDGYHEKIISMTNFLVT